LQEYCLDCGLRLRGGGVVPALASGWRRRLRWYPGDWVWPSLLALVVAAVAGAGAIWWTRDASSAAATTVVGGTAPLPTVATTESAPTAPSATVPTPTRPTTTAPQPQPPRRALIEWPEDRNGWTLVLASLPTSAGRPAALGQAREALRAGLDEVGVLSSSEYASLHPGYYVVFSGVYPSISAAQDAVSKAADAGYEAAYARRVTS
jgi:nitrogen fixation protein